MDDFLWGLSTEELKDKYDVSTHTLNCPKCHASVELPVFDFVNVTEHPEIKEKILNKEVFTLFCRKCGHRELLILPMLYKDDDKMIFINLCQSEADAIAYRFPLDNPMCKMLAETHQLRAVNGVNGLIEKIRIFDDGLNELAIAYLKKRIIEQMDSLKWVFYDHIMDENIHFAVGMKNGSVRMINFPLKAYEGAAGYVEATGIANRLNSYCLDANVFEKE